VTDEEERAEQYRRSRVRGARVERDRERQLRGDDDARREVEQNWRPLLPGQEGDTSYPENRN
jgi:hypothetical protein